MKTFRVLLPLLAGILAGCAAPDLSVSSPTAVAVVGQYEGMNDGPNNNVPLEKLKIGTLTLNKNGTYTQTFLYGGQTYHAEGRWQIREEWDGDCVVLSNGWGVEAGAAKRQPEVVLRESTSHDTVSGKDTLFLRFTTATLLAYSKETLKAKVPGVVNGG